MNIVSLLEIKRNAVGRFFFVFKIQDVSAIIVSKSFSDRALLEVCISQIRNLAKFSRVIDQEDTELLGSFYKIHNTSQGHYSFSLHGMAGEVLMVSEMFYTREECMQCVVLLKENALEARVLDLA